MENQKIFSRDIVLLLAGSFFYMASPMLVTPLITGFSEKLGAGAFIMGIVGGLTNLCSLIVQPFSGGIADKVSKYRLGCIGTVFLVVACAGYAISANPVMILAFRVINGIGFAFCSVCFSTWISNILPPNKIGFGMGMYGMMNALAMAISPAIGVEIYQKQGYRMAFCVATAFALICLLIIQFCKNKGLPISISVQNEKQKINLIEMRVIPLSIVIACFAIPYCATQSFIVRYSETRGLNIKISMFFTIYAISLLLSRLVMSNLFDKLKFKVFLVIGSSCALLSMLFMSIMKNNFEMALGAVFMSWGYGLMCTVAQSAAVTSIEPEKRGLANGTYYIGLNTGMAFGPMIGGVLYGNVPINMYYPILMIMVPLCIALYLISKKILKRQYKK